MPTINKQIAFVNPTNSTKATPTVMPLVVISEGVEVSVALRFFFSTILTRALALLGQPITKSTLAILVGKKMRNVTFPTFYSGLLEEKNF